MDFEFSGDQDLLRESVRRYLTERAPIAYVRDHISSSTTRDDIWLGLAELGLTGMLIPEGFGGAGMGMVDLALPLGEMGRSVYPGPFAASAIGAVVTLRTLDDADASAQWLPGLGAGTTVAVIASSDSRDSRTTVDGTGAVTGTKVHVLDAAAADVLFVTADAADGPAIVAIESGAPGVTLTVTDTVDVTRRFGQVHLDSASGQRLNGHAAAAIVAADDTLGVAMVLDGIGAAERALELTLEYAKNREQFGKPIGSFQAVQHLCADMLRAIELGRAVAYYAAWACDAADPTERHRAATMARAFAADGLYRVAANAIQVFGGIGFTWEHDIHLFYKRLLTLQLFGGSAGDHLEELAAVVL